MLLLLLACAAPDTEPSCVRDDDPPGDPIYRDCLITTEASSGTTERRTDAKGRSTHWSDGQWTWTWAWEGACEVETRSMCTDADGASCGTRVMTRECDTRGNPTTVTEEYTDREGDVLVSSVDIAYEYDAEGRVLVAVSTVRGSEDPPSRRTCTYSAWATPDACVTNPTSDDDTTDDVSFDWTYDADGNPLSYEIHRMNPGYADAWTWERDARGRTIASSSYDSVLSQTVERVHSYRGDVLDLVTATESGFSMGPTYTTLYRYQTLE